MPKIIPAESKNAVIYARYSSHNQSEQSIEGQLRDAYDFAQREGYNVVGEYIDRAISGKTDDRPDFQRMLADAPKHQFQFVLVWKLDRFARNRMEAAFNRQKLSKHGIKLISVKENISDAPEGIIMESMLEAMAEYYSANLAQNIKRGMRESSLNGRYIKGSKQICFGTHCRRLVRHCRIPRYRTKGNIRSTAMVQVPTVPQT